MDALAGSWAGAAAGAVGGLVLGAALGGLVCLGDTPSCGFGVMAGATMTASLGYLLGTVAGVTLGIGGHAGEGFAAVGLTLLIAGIEVMMFAGLGALTQEPVFTGVGYVVPAASIPFVAPLLAVALFEGSEPARQTVHVAPRVSPVQDGAVFGLSGAF